MPEIKASMMESLRWGFQGEIMPEGCVFPAEAGSTPSLERHRRLKYSLPPSCKQTRGRHVKRDRRLAPDTETPEPTEDLWPAKEVCGNPWNGECTSTNIALYIMYKGRRLPICRRCWEAISSRNIEWKYD